MDNAMESAGLWNQPPNLAENGSLVEWNEHEDRQMNGRT